MSRNIHAPKKPGQHTPRVAAIDALLRALSLTVLVGAAQPGSAQQVYRVVDENGNVSFTDSPSTSQQSQAQPITIEQTNRAKPVAPANRSEASTPEAPAAISFDTRILAPSQNTTIPMGPGNFAVRARVTPSLRNDESVQLLIDNEPFGEPQRRPNWSLTNIFRGAHALQVLRLDADGRELDRSSTVTVYVLRPSIR